MRKLTTRKYWSGNYKEPNIKKFTLKRFLSNYSFHKLDDIFHNYLSKSNNKKILKIGCAPGNWLIYFNKQFNYLPYGIEYTKCGCKVTKTNLKKNGVDGKIICGDLFKTSFKTMGPYILYMGCKK